MIDIVVMIISMMIYMVMNSNNMTYRTVIRIGMKMRMQFGIKSLEMILLPASITSREIYKLQETKEDEKKRVKKLEEEVRKGMKS